VFPLQIPGGPELVLIALNLVILVAVLVGNLWLA
jgi:hypothetical protein